MNIQTIRKYVEWAGKVWPTGLQALHFVVTEVGEAMDAWIRQNESFFVRNNPDKETNLGYELGDLYMMAQIASHELTGRSLEENARLKLHSKGFNIYGPYESVDQIFQQAAKIRVENPDITEDQIRRNLWEDIGNWQNKNLVGNRELTKEEYEFPAKVKIDFEKIGVKEEDVVTHKTRVDEWWNSMNDDMKKLVKKTFVNFTNNA